MPPQDPLKSRFLGLMGEERVREVLEAEIELTWASTIALRPLVISGAAATAPRRVSSVGSVGLDAGEGKTQPSGRVAHKSAASLGCMPRFLCGCMPRAAASLGCMPRAAAPRQHGMLPVRQHVMLPLPMPLSDASSAYASEHLCHGQSCG